MVEQIAFERKNLANEPGEASAAPHAWSGTRSRAGQRVAPLVNTTKSVNARRVVICPETGVVTSFVRFPGRDEFTEETDASAPRFERYALQSLARSILSNHAHPKGLSTSWRVTECLRRVQGGDVRVLRSIEHGTAHYGNLRVCGSVWTCPVCAGKISEFRKSEIEAAATCHKAAGGFMYMVTYTFSHSRQDSLKQLLGDSERNSGLRAALRRLRVARGYKSLTKGLGLVGLIRNLEVTHGDANGWHPHVHELWLTTERLSVHALQAVKNTLFRLWADACLKAGLSAPNRQRGVDVVQAHDPAEYLQKWGREQRWSIGSELAKSHTKRGSGNKGRTPFDLLRQVESSKNPEYLKSLFAEYSTVFYGARQCFWTAGLKSMFALAERSDEEIAAAQEDKAIEICSISIDKWKKLISLPYEARSLVLRLAETGGAEAVELYLSGL